MQLTMRKSFVATAIVGGVLAVSGGAAYAYWTATGTGSGEVTTASESPRLVVTQNTFAGSKLVPGGDGQTISGTIENPNTFQVPVTSFTAVPTVDAGHAGCLASWYAISDLSVPTEIAAGAKVDFSGKIRLVDVSASQDACKGATVTVSYAVNGG